MKDSNGNWLSTIDRTGSSPIFGYQQGQNGHHVYYTGRTVSINAGTSWSTTSNGIYINSSNNVGIGTASPSYKLHVSGNVGASNFYTTSDRSLKKNIKDLSSSTLEELFSISNKLIKSFSWKDSGKLSCGFIAQQLEQCIPEAITEDNKGIKSVSYDVAFSKIIASLVYKVKVLEAKVESSLHS